MGGSDVPDGKGHWSQRLIDPEPVLVLLPVEEVSEVGGAGVRPLNDGLGGEAAVRADPGLPVGGRVLQQAEASSLQRRRREGGEGRREDTNLPRGVTRLPTALAAIVGHPPVLAGVSRQRDLLLNLAANLVPKVRAAATKILMLIILIGGILMLTRGILVMIMMMPIGGILKTKWTHVANCDAGSGKKVGQMSRQVYESPVTHPTPAIRDRRRYFTEPVTGIAFVKVG